MLSACISPDSDDHLRDTLIRALTEPWCPPGELARAGADLVKLNPDIVRCITRATDAWPQRLSAHDLFGSAGFDTVATDPLLRALLDSTPICDLELERFLTMARQIMLNAATTTTAFEVEEESALAFYSALARQCFINEYVFAWTDEEVSQAQTLRDSLVAALKTEAPIPAFWPVTVAAYFPLYSLPVAARLMDRPWPNTVTAVLAQQIREPEEELQYSAAMPRLTTIEDEVSLLVQNQYEKNPYPRWVKAAPVGKPVTIDRLLRRYFPLTSFQPLGKSSDLDILIAGCGTGQHSINTAQTYQGARVLAVDLSLASLSYAKRKTQELGLPMIEYAQADILKLGSLGRSFDVIESVGVLHHLDDPMAGWQVLLSLLRPGGIMKLGFYSEVARRGIVQIRSFIAKQGYGSTPEEIRRCRQDLMDSDKSEWFERLMESADFFSVSACRDLLFHVQEHRMTLTDIEMFLKKNNLVFIGFQMEADVIRAYKRRFPDDLAATNLGQWQVFENENPYLFSGMYRFWVQNTGKPFKIKSI